jgi:hypothetical protein
MQQMYHNSNLKNKKSFSYSLNNLVSLTNVTIDDAIKIYYLNLYYTIPTQTHNQKEPKQNYDIYATKNS